MTSIASSADAGVERPFAAQESAVAIVCFWIML